ncbi:HNH endonuclease [Actinokineospora cianjurensis]|uniref:HNH endonuclease n=1 Tax=Actinokineospora cianjurensis TaxID=585224 RepID=UPI000EAE64A0|nr:HNH endonuclease [Actinokineospora cianjurensis]
MDLILGRDGATCIWCARPFRGQAVPTTDHLVPRVKGGPSWVENEVAACRGCNRLRGHTSPVDWLVECQRLGWAPDGQRVVKVLRELEVAIAVRGGQRRARAYVEGQLRRVAKL